MDTLEYSFGVYSYTTRKLAMTTPSYDMGFVLCMRLYKQYGRTFYVAPIR